MYKKLIALLIVCTMLVSIPPAVAAADTVPRPTVDEILNEYHQKAFEAEAAGEASAAAYSPRSGQSGKTLEQETVETLTAAGYEAYNVTGDNYETLESELNTDFSEMGLDTDGSYIVVIHGEDFENNSTSPRAVVPTPDPGGDSFTYTYGGTTYTMRYLTVTTYDRPEFGKSDDVDLLNSPYAEDIARVIDSGISIALDLISQPLHLGTVASILGLSITHFAPDQTATLSLFGSVNWTRTYTQVWSDYDELWLSGSSVEYAQTLTSIFGHYYSALGNHYTEVHEGPIERVVYSDHYNDHTWRRNNAARGKILTETFYDCTGDVEYAHDDEIVLTLVEDIFP